MFTLVLTSARAQTTTAAPASAGFDAHGFELVALDADPRDAYTVQRPGGFSQADWFGAALIEYARAPLVRITETEAGEQRVSPVVDNLLAANVSVGVAPFERLRLDVTAPFYALSTGDDYLAQGPAMGDLRAGGMVVALRPDPLDPDGGGFGLGLIGQAIFPTGTPSRYLGSGGYGAVTKLALTYEFRRVTITADGGVQFNPAVELENVNGSDEALAGLAIGVLANDEFGFTLEGHTEPSLAPAAIPKGDPIPLPPVEGLLSLRYASHSGALWTVGLAAGLTDGPGVAQYRLLVGGGFGSRQTAASLDVDTIGVLRASDLCPLEAESLNGWKDEDGCPDRLGSLQLDVRYRTESRAADAEITGPNGVQNIRIGPQGLTLDAVPGTVFGVEASDGCLAGTGNATAGEVGTALVVEMQPVFDAELRVEVVGPTDTPLGGALVAWKSEHPECVPVGTAIADQSGGVVQGVASGKHTLVVTASGHNVIEQPVEVLVGDRRTVRVKLAASKIVLEKKEIRILEKVQFEFGKAVLRSESYPLLNEVASVIVQNPEVGRVEVGGHTDNKGSDTFNLQLSQSRADAVKDYLVGQGVPLSRLVSVGYGETRPIDTNKTESGREANRRVEFRLIDQSPPGGGAR
ncbi:MAG: OmpA family protein [Myxococcota bacterium]